MTVIKSKLNYLRISPRKVRIVVKSIKNLPVLIAEKQLLFQSKKAAKEVFKLLKSAIANASVKGLKKNDLYVKNIVVNEGPKKLKRFYPKARGQVGRIIKKTSHIEIFLDLINNKIKK